MKTLFYFVTSIFMIVLTSAIPLKVKHQKIKSATVAAPEKRLTAVKIVGFYQSGPGVFSLASFATIKNLVTDQTVTANAKGEAILNVSLGDIVSAEIEASDLYGTKEITQPEMNDRYVTVILLPQP